MRKILFILFFIPIYVFSQTGNFRKINTDTLVMTKSPSVKIYKINLHGDTLYFNGLEYCLSGITGSVNSYNGDRTITRATMPFGKNFGTNTYNALLDSVFFPWIRATISLSGNYLAQIGSRTVVTLISTITQNNESSNGLIYGNIRQNSRPTGIKRSWGVGNIFPITCNVVFTPIKGSTDSLGKTFVAYEYCNNNNNPVTINSSVVTLSSCYPYLYGMSASNFSMVNSFFFRNMGKITQNYTSPTLVTFDSPTTLKYAYFAYPASYPDLTSIKDQNLFEVLGSFTKTTINVQSTEMVNNWSEVSYKVYKSNNMFTPSSWEYTFK